MDSAFFLCAENVGIAACNADLKMEFRGGNETKILMGEPVAILGTAKNGKYYKVQTCNYKGYVQAKNIGKCSHDVLQKFCFGREFAVAREYFYHNGSLIRMGCRLPLHSEGEQYVKCLVPYNVFGLLVVRKQDFPRCCMQKGYLKLNADNVLKLAGNALDMPYSWGDEGDGIDCSSFVNGVFRCMGVLLPRNVSQLLQLEAPSVVVEGGSIPELYASLEKMGPGSLLLTRQHVMIYAGMDEGEVRFIHCSSRMGGKCVYSGGGPYLSEAVKIISLTQV